MAAGAQWETGNRGMLRGYSPGKYPVSGSPLSLA
jgi:hypothetical protein